MSLLEYMLEYELAYGSRYEESSAFIYTLVLQTILPEVVKESTAELFWKVDKYQHAHNRPRCVISAIFENSMVSTKELCCLANSDPASFRSHITPKIKKLLKSTDDVDALKNLGRFPEFFRSVVENKNSPEILTTNLHRHYKVLLSTNYVMKEDDVVICRRILEPGFFFSQLKTNRSLARSVLEYSASLTEEEQIAIYSHREDSLLMKSMMKFALSKEVLGLLWDNQVVSAGAFFEVLQPEMPEAVALALSKAEWNPPLILLHAEKFLAMPECPKEVRKNILVKASGVPAVRALVKETNDPWIIQTVASMPVYRIEIWTNPNISADIKRSMYFSQVETVCKMLGGQYLYWQELVGFLSHGGSKLLAFDQFRDSVSKCHEFAGYVLAQASSLDFSDGPMDAAKTQEYLWYLWRLHGVLMSDVLASHGSSPNELLSDIWKRVDEAKYPVNVSLYIATNPNVSRELATEVLYKHSDNTDFWRQVEPKVLLSGILSRIEVQRIRRNRKLNRPPLLSQKRGRKKKNV